MVTGADGFVGRHLLPALRATWPNSVIVAPNLDVRDNRAVSDAIRDVAPSCCVHLAAITSVIQAAQGQREAWAVNLHGTLHVAHAILAHAPNCQMLFASSSDAYGASFLMGTKLSETAPLAPMSLYGVTKAAADLALGALAMEGLRVVRLRPFNHIGAGQTADFVIASFASQIARISAGLQSPTMLVGRLDTYRDFLDVQDVCAAYISCIARSCELEPGVIINLASGTARRIGDVLKEMLTLAGVAATIETESPRVRRIDIVHAGGDATLAQSLLAWQPVIAWQDTLSSVLADWRRRTQP
jgi:GDP-4-dehydro-6-deoxy-D-mannose reductase